MPSILNPHTGNLLIALLFILVFNGLFFLRGERLSPRFTFEVIILGVILTLLALAAGITLNTILFLVALYLITMRVRLLVDLATLLSRHGMYKHSELFFNLALKAWPDPVSRRIALIDKGALLVRQGMSKDAVSLLEGVLNETAPGGLSKRLEAACRYNLGLAYIRSGEEGKGEGELKSVVVLAPGSPYSHASKTLLSGKREQ